MPRACAVIQLQIEIVLGAGDSAADGGESKIRLGFGSWAGCCADLARFATSSGPRRALPKALLSGVLYIV